MKDFLKMILASAIGFLIANVLLGIFAVFIIIGLSALFMIDGGGSDLSSTSVSKNSILFLNVEGDINERRTPGDVFKHLMGEDSSAPLSIYELNQALKMAAEDKKIKGVYLRLRWVSSGWAKVNAIRDMLLEFKKSKKFVYAYSESYNEKLYYLASAADKIYMYPKGEFSWDGLDMQSTFFQKTFTKLEVEPTLVRAGRFKAAGETFIKDRMSEENKLQSREIISGLWGHVEKAIVASRPQLNVELLSEWAGKVSVTTAQEAYNKGLVDVLAPIEEIEQLFRKITKTAAKDEIPLISWDGYYDLQKPSVGFMDQAEKVAVIVADGEISSGSGPSDQAIYSDQLSALIRKVSKEKNVKAVVLRINSPGGSALASDVIWRSLDFLKKNKPVVATFSDVAASGGYYIAAGANYIYADPLTITGSIGVFGLLFNTNKFFDNKLGVTFDGVKTHESSDMMSGVRALSPYELQLIQKSVDDIYHTFVSVVKEGRPQFEDLEAVKSIAEGRVWTGIKAKEIGLIDDFGSLETAIQKAAELAKLDDYSVEIYPKEKKFIDKIFESLGEVSILPAWVKQIFLKSPHKFESIYYTRIPYDYSI